MSARMSQAAPVGDASIPAASAASAFVAAFSWRLLAGGVMIEAEVARMTSRFGDSRTPKYGPMMVFPRKFEISESGWCDSEFA